MANILVVDDEMGIRELLSEILGDEGHVVQLAENAQQARADLQSATSKLEAAQAEVRARVQVRVFSQSVFFAQASIAFASIAFPA